MRGNSLTVGDNVSFLQGNALALCCTCETRFVSFAKYWVFMRHSLLLP